MTRDMKMDYPKLWAVLLDVYSALPDEHAHLSDRLIEELCEVLPDLERA